MDFALQHLQFTNFRCFSSSALGLDERLTVLIADNGHGKSATLDAIAICLGQLLGPAQAKPRTPVADRIQIAPSDATTQYAIPPYAQSTFPIELKATAQVDGASVSWTGVADGPDASPTWEIPTEAAAVASAKTRGLGPDVTLPVFAYYGTNRTGASVLQATPPNLGRLERGYGYQNALQADASLNELGPWLAQGEWERSGRGFSIWGSALDAVYEASAQVLRSYGVTRVSYSMEDRDLILDIGRLQETDDGVIAVDAGRGSTVIPMRLSAHGYRSVLGMVTDLAFRCGVLNAHLEGEAAQLTSGVVLIDEIDMHLHPKWQTHILKDLALAFPRIQFVASTHSPFILSSVSGDSVRQIDSIDGRSTFATSTMTTEGAKIDLLAEALLDAPVRAPSRFADLLDNLSTALQDRDLDRAEEYATQLEDLDPPVDDEDATRLLLELTFRQERAKEDGASS